MFSVASSSTNSLGESVLPLGLAKNSEIKSPGPAQPCTTKSCRAAPAKRNAARLWATVCAEKAVLSLCGLYQMTQERAAARRALQGAATFNMPEHISTNVNEWFRRIFHTTLPPGERKAIGVLPRAGRRASAAVAAEVTRRIWPGSEFRLVYLGGYGRMTNLVCTFFKFFIAT